jgi:hypothetical protein
VVVRRAVRLVPGGSCTAMFSKQFDNPRCSGALQARISSCHNYELRLFTVRSPLGVDNLPLTESANLSLFCRSIHFRFRVAGKHRTVGDPSNGMSARRETYRVYMTRDGWLVQSNCGPQLLGPYADQEHAIVMALVAVREARPSQLRITNSLGEWRADVIYTDDLPAPPTSQQSASSEVRCCVEGAPHVSQ